MRYLVAVLVLSGCSYSFQPFQPGYSKDEIRAAFGQRDQAIETLANVVKKLDERIGKDEKK